jgi:sugar phosphate isomerase/epimerase
MHVKDLAARGEKESQVAVGRGLIDFPALFKTLIDIGYPGQVGLEYEIYPKDPLPGMIESMAYMRGVLAAVTRAS